MRLRRKAHRLLRHFGGTVWTAGKYCVVNRRLMPLLVVLLLLVVGFASVATFVVTPYLYPLF
jgi:hypothetical protein